MKDPVKRSDVETVIDLWNLVYGPPKSASVVDVLKQHYFNALRHLNRTQFALCADLAGKECTFFPKPADILKHKTDVINMVNREAELNRKKLPHPDDMELSEEEVAKNDMLMQIAMAIIAGEVDKDDGLTEMNIMIYGEDRPH